MRVKYWTEPARDIVFPSGYSIEGCDPFGDFCGVGVSTNQPDKGVIYGTVKGLRPAPGLKEWSLGVWMNGSLAIDRQVMWYGENQVIYRYQAVTTPSVPPSSGNPPGGNPPIGTGASNTTLPLPPYGQSEPNTNSPGMALQAAQRRVAARELVLVPVYLIKGNNVANINFDLTYNAAVAKPEGTIQKGSLLDNAILSANPNTSGTIRIGFAQSSGISGTGSVAFIPFRAVGKPGDKTSLALQVTTINNPNGSVPAIDRIPGEITILGTGQALPGDCDGNGKLEEPDAECALDMSTGLRPQNLIMDMDASGDVTSRDATLILQAILRSLGIR